MTPEFWLRSDMRRTLNLLERYDQQDIERRLGYYHPVSTAFSPTENARNHRTFDRTGINSTYYYDFKEFLRYFDSTLRFDYRFGDNTINPEYPAFVKSRPILVDGQNGILFKLNKLRHFYFVDVDIPFDKKKNVAVFRGACKRPHRRQFVETYAGLPNTDIGDSRPGHKGQTGWKPFMSIKEQLQNKFIISIEGNDVATNLKWIMSSNSLCFMRKPRYETWFMEGTLEPGKHYVQLKDDFSDLGEKIDYYASHPEEGLEIITNAHLYVKQFRDPLREKLLCLLVMEKYFRLSGQL